jgi:multiple antibiotic resistance protein
MEQQLQAIATILSLVNPLICGAMFAQIEAGQTQAARLADATKASLAVLVILVVAALAGARVLQIFGVSLDAFAVAGGGILTWIGINMLRSNSAPAPAAPQDAASKEPEERSITPVILFAASPGTITGVITLAVAHARLELPVTALVAVAVAVGVLWIAMVLMARGTAHPSRSLFRETARSMMGLIVVAMGVQFALTGIHGFFRAAP